MPVLPPLYAEIDAQLQRYFPDERLRVTALARFAFLITGILLSRTVVLTRIAAELAAWDGQRLTAQDNATRRLRRTLADPRLVAYRLYYPAIRAWLRRAVAGMSEPRLVLALDESSLTDRIHLFRVSLLYWGGALPLAWAIWPKNQPLPDGFYGREVDVVLRDVAALLPPGVDFIVLADRAYDNAEMTDRLSAFGWHWVIRVKIGGDLRFRDRLGREYKLADLCARFLRRPGDRFKARGEVFKKAGWRTVSVAGYWGPGHKEPVVVLSDLPARWTLLNWYDRRFWIETGFRTDKSQGWNWEASQVRNLNHQEVLLTAMAWASWLTLGLGVLKAQARLSALARRAPVQRGGRTMVGHTDHARESVFQMGLAELRRVAYHRLTGALEALDWTAPLAASWAQQWRSVQAQRYLRFHRSFT